MNLANPDSMSRDFICDQILRCEESSQTRRILNVALTIPRCETSPTTPMINNPTTALSLINICEFIFFSLSV